MREGDRVKIIGSVVKGDYHKEGIITSIDGGYVYVKLDWNHFKNEIEYLRNEVEVIEVASDKVNKQYLKKEYKEIIEFNKNRIKESQIIIDECQSKLENYERRN